MNPAATTGIQSFAQFPLTSFCRLQFPLFWLLPHPRTLSHETAKRVIYIAKDNKQLIRPRLVCLGLFFGRSQSITRASSWKIPNQPKWGINQSQKSLLRHSTPRKPQMPKSPPWTQPNQLNNVFQSPALYFYETTHPTLPELHSQSFSLEKLCNKTNSFQYT